MILVAKPASDNRAEWLPDIEGVLDLLIAADPAFTGALEMAGMQRPDLRGALLDALQDTTTDLHQLNTVYIEGRIAALACTMPAHEVPSRRLATLRHIVRRTSAAISMRAALTRFSAGVPQVDGQGCYLARIATQAEFRRRGIAGELMAAFESAARDTVGGPKLHVAKENDLARGFYERRGYSVVATGTSHVLLGRLDWSQA